VTPYVLYTSSSTTLAWPLWPVTDIVNLLLDVMGLAANGIWTFPTRTYCPGHISPGKFPQDNLPSFLHCVGHFPDSFYFHTHTTLFAIKGSNNKKTNKTKKKKRNKTLQDKSNTTRQHNSILGLIFSTQSTNDIIGYVELVQKNRFSPYAHRRQRKVKHEYPRGAKSPPALLRRFYWLK